MGQKKITCAKAFCIFGMQQKQTENVTSAAAQLGKLVWSSME